MTASVVTKQNIVARWGSIIPTPLAMPPSVTGRPLISTRRAASLGRVSVVMIASAAARPPCGESAFTSLGSAGRIRSMGSGTPMTPVDAMSTCWGGDAQEIAHQARHLAGVAKPLLARAHVGAAARGQDGLGRRLPGRAPRRRDGRALHLVGGEDRGHPRRRRGVTRARSFLPLGLIPAATPPARTPGTAVTPPSSHSRSAISRIHRGGFEPVRSSHPNITLRFWTPLADAALAEVVDGGHAGRPARAGIGDHGHVTEVRAHDGRAWSGARPRRPRGRTAPPRRTRGTAPRDRRSTPARVSGTDAVVKSPRFSGSRCGVKDTRRGSPRQRRQLLFHLGGVPMEADAVGLHVLVGLRVEVHGIDLPPLRAGAGHARLAVDDDAVRRAPGRALSSGAVARMAPTG